MSRKQLNLSDLRKVRGGAAELGKKTTSENVDASAKHICDCTKEPATKSGD